MFWTDKWLSCCPLYQYALNDVSQDMLHSKIGDFLDDGVWDLNGLKECLPDNIIHLILSVHVGFQGSGADKCIWQFTLNGTFSVHSAY